MEAPAHDAGIRRDIVGVTSRRPLAGLSELRTRAHARVVAGRYDFVESVYGPELCADWDDKTFQLCTQGYGPFVADAINAYREPFVFLDIGANVGVFSLVAARHELCRRVHAFEPVPATYFRLCINLVRNRAGKVRAHRAAISSRAGLTATMTFNPLHTGMSKLVDGSTHGVTVRTITAVELNRLVKPTRLPIVAKIDVEGSEAQVVQELARTDFFNSIDRVIIEVSRRNADDEEIDRLLHLLADNAFVETSRSGEHEHYDALFERPRS